MSSRETGPVSRLPAGLPVFVLTPGRGKEGGALAFALRSFSSHLESLPAASSPRARLHILYMYFYSPPADGPGLERLFVHTSTYPFIPRTLTKSLMFATHSAFLEVIPSLPQFS